MRAWMLLGPAALAAGCKSETRASVCHDLGAQTIALADQMSSALGAPMSASDRAEIRTKAKELEQQCLTWPPEVFACMRPGADPDSPKCQEALALADGKVHADLDRAPDGPPVVATGQLGEAPVFAGYQVAVTADGGLISLEREAVSAYGPDGKPRWHTPLGRLDWMLVLPDGTIVTGDGKTSDLVALDPATGAERWRVAPPPPDDEYEDHQVEAAVQLGDRLVIALANATFYRVDPAACAKSGARCLTRMFQLPDESLDDPTLAAVGGDLLLGESDAIRRLTPAGKTVATIRVRDTSGGVAALPSGQVAAVLDDELVLFDLAKCEAPAPVVLPRKQGRMYMRGEGDCDECAAPPPGCVVARPDLGDVDSQTPLVLRDGSLAVTVDDGVSRVSADGAKLWTSQVPMLGKMVELDGRIAGLASGVGEDLDDAPAFVAAVDLATGKVAWRRRLGVKTSFIASTTDVVVAVTPPWLVAGNKGAVAWLKLP